MACLICHVVSNLLAAREGRLLREPRCFARLEKKYLKTSQWASMKCFHYDV